MSRLQAYGDRIVRAVMPLAPHLATEEPASVLLLELVAIHGIVQEIGEVREQIHVIHADVKIRVRMPVGFVTIPLRHEAVAARLAA
jgi:hypothetical protein